MAVPGNCVAVTRLPIWLPVSVLLVAVGPHFGLLVRLFSRLSCAALMAPAGPWPVLSSPNAKAGAQAYGSPHGSCVQHSRSVHLLVQIHDMMSYLANVPSDLTYLI